MRADEIKVLVEYTQEGNRFVAHSPALDISTCAQTLEHTKKRFQELVHIYIDELFRMGTLELALIECGWTKVGQKEERHWAAPKLIEQTEQAFKIPVKKE